MDRLFEEKDDDKQKEYFLKHYKKEIYQEVLGKMGKDISCEMIEKLLVSKPVAPEFVEAINNQIKIFNTNFRKASPKISKEIEGLHNELIKHIQIYLKLEWGRVKDESQGRLNSKENVKYRKKVDKMIREYELQLYDYELEKLPGYLKGE